MADKELRKLSRAELVDIIYELQKPQTDAAPGAGSGQGTGSASSTPELNFQEVDRERKRLKYKKRYRAVLRSTVGTLLVVAAIAVLISTLWLPFLRIYGSSMTPTLQDGEIVCCVKTSDYTPGDIVAFYYNNKILIKRVIGQPGDWIDFDEDGTVYVNEEPLDEPYLTDKALGECDIQLPYQVPEEKIFVLGDHRSTSVDSRHSTVGCVAQEQVVGKIWIRLWPFEEFDIFDLSLTGGGKNVAQ